MLLTARKITHTQVDFMNNIGIDLQQVIARATESSDKKPELELFFKEINSSKVQKNVRELDNFILSEESGRRQRAERSILKTYEKYMQSLVSFDAMAQSKLLEPNLLIHQIKNKVALEKAGYQVDIHNLVFNPFR